MSWFGDLYKSAVGKKAVMAASGIVLFGFVLVHMIGNLKLYEGVDEQGHYILNNYAGFLRSVGTPALPTSGLLWIARAVLLVAVLLHIWAAWQLTRMNREARPVGYARRDLVQAGYASRTMRWGGVIILLFVVYHLLDLTFGTANPSYVEGDVYHNVVASFSRWPVALFYVLANVALGFHLYHGLWSMFQSLGWNHPRFNSWRRRFAQAFALLITLGNVSFPLAVLAGFIH
jgi:succinate dehydrogenase cytochrome b subunit